MNMPFAALERPSLALGILSSILASSKIKVQILYGNLLLCNHIKVEDYVMIEKSSSTFGIADWVFSSLVFEDKTDTDEIYLDKLIGELKLSAYVPPDTFRGRLRAVKKTVKSYIEEITDRIAAENPRMVGCSSTFQQHLPSLALLKRVREKCPEIVTLMGGANCETTMGVATHKNFEFVDYVVSGEADELIVPLVKAILGNGAHVPIDEISYGVFAPFHRIKGYPKVKQESNGCSDPFPRATLSSLKNILPPDYDAYFATLAGFPELKRTLVSCLPVETSRGCFWGKCRFCGLNGRNNGQRAKPVEQVVNEIAKLHDRYNIDRIEAVDNALHSSHVPDLFKQFIHQGSRYRIFYEVRTTLKREDIKIMSESGVIWTQPGIESLHSKILHLMKKGTFAWQNIQYLKWARQYGIRSVWKIMFDFPDEKDEWYDEMAKIIPLLFHLEPPDSVNQVRYDRYSDYYWHADRYKLDLKPYPLIAFNYDLPEKELMDLSSYFEDVKRRKRDNDPILSILIGTNSRTGLHKVKRAVKEWNNLFWGKELDRPELLIVRKASNVYIIDTRPIAVRTIHELDGLEAKIYLACDAAQKIDVLRKTFINKEGASSNDFDKTVKFLIDQNLLLIIDDRILALAIELPYRPFPKPTDYPAGYWIGAKPTKG
ncbi:MAG: RiPP maturation radical SAM C-methyltransferase [Proteobacteria bacterium]|nr:RiPP maturation radical SAM C-methyltransferase [Pseudomonadota bacterium]